MVMKKTDIKRMFQAIEKNDKGTLNQLFDGNADALETVGIHNANCRDKHL